MNDDSEVITEVWSLFISESEDIQEDGFKAPYHSRPIFRVERVSEKNERFPAQSILLRVRTYWH